MCWAWSHPLDADRPPRARSTRAVALRRGVALLLARICEDKTWSTCIRREMQRLQVVTYRGPAGEAQQCTTPTGAQKEILAALDVAPPPRL